MEGGRSAAGRSYAANPPATTSLEPVAASKLSHRSGRVPLRAEREAGLHPAALDLLLAGRRYRLHPPALLAHQAPMRDSPGKLGACLPGPAESREPRRLQPVGAVRSPSAAPRRASSLGPHCERAEGQRGASRPQAVASGPGPALQRRCSFSPRRSSDRGGGPLYARRLIRRTPRLLGGPPATRDHCKRPVGE